MKPPEFGHNHSGPSDSIKLLASHPAQALSISAIAVIAWLALAWMATDMSHPLVRLTMPTASSWTGANIVAVFLMWAIMMAAMMLPSALPMILAFAGLSKKAAEPARARSFVTAYLALWFGFSVIATGMQWVLQALGWVDPMVVSTSAGLTSALLLIAGIYQFSPLKRMCLSKCRTPLGFLVGEWRPGPSGAFRMGVRHGMFCIGCCWALMALLFVGGAMNLAWVAALAVAVALEKLIPGGDRLAAALGVVLIASGMVKLLAIAA